MQCSCLERQRKSTGRSPLHPRSRCQSLNSWSLFVYHTSPDPGTMFSIAIFPPSPSPSPCLSPDLPIPPACSFISQCSNASLHRPHPPTRSQYQKASLTHTSALALPKPDIPPPPHRRPTSTPLPLHPPSHPHLPPASSPPRQSTSAPTSHPPLVTPPCSTSSTRSSPPAPSPPSPRRHTPS